ncbi:MAG: hypothetical protein WB709_06165 [Solirubrobacteraceae bacterium]
MAFNLKIEPDRNMPQVRLSARLSSAFADVADLESLVATITDRTIAGERFVPIGDLSVLVERIVPWPWS